MKTYLSPDAIKNFSIPADKLSNTIVFKFFQTLDENNSIFLPDENFKEHNWEVIQKFNESYIYGNGSTDIYYITLLCPKEEEWHIATHERYTGQIRIDSNIVCGLMFNDYPLMPEPDVIKYKGIVSDLEVWSQETNPEWVGLTNDELFESFSNNLFIRVTDFEVPTNTYLNNSYIPKFAIDLTGRIEATYEEFSYRPSAGDKSIRDDSAIIKRIKGNTIIWNQQNPDPKLNSSTLRITGKDMGVVNGFRRLESEDGSATLLQMRVASSPYSIKEHIYLVTFRAKTDSGSITFYTNGAFSKDLTMAVSADTIVYGEYITTGRAANYIIPSIKAQNATYLEATDLQIYDLTQMFGVGNELSTVEEFKALFPNGNYEYNTGEIRSLNIDGIKTTGFNQWDEEWELGNFNTSTGENNSTTIQIRSKNLIKVLPNTDYFITSEALAMFFDNSHNIITPTSGTIYGNALVINGNFTTPISAQYMKFYKNSDYGNVYKNDICINISHTHVRNGEYEPYEERIMSLDKLSKYMPLHSVGSVYDEINANEVIKRIKVVKLKDLTWTSPTADLLSKSIFNAKISDMRPRGEGENETTYRKSIICSKYGVASNTSMGDSLTDKSIFKQGSAYGIVIRDTTYTTIDDFVASMTDDDVVYYELVEPIKIEFDEVVDLTYNVYDFGTEQIISSVPTTQFRGDIIYQFNATDTIRQNKNNIEIISDKLEVTELPNGNINVKGLGNFMSATPSGNPQHNLFVKAGAVYNEDSGFWEVNGKTDITNDEMETMYLEAYLTRNVNNLTNWFINSNSRTNLCLAYHNQAVALNSVFAMCYNLEVATLGTSAECLPTNISSLFYLCRKLQTCTTIINAQYLTSANNAFEQCYALTDIRIKNLGIDIVLIDSPLLNKISILYLIDNVNPDKNVKIKVNSDVKTLCDTDPDIQSALSAHTNVTIE